MTVREALCSCGQVAARCAGEPLLVSLCHCRECQRRTGSAFGVAAFFEEGRVELRGETTCYRRPSDSGFDIRFHFCPACGTTVFWYPERKPGIVAVAVGCFADPAFPAPTQSVYEDHRAPWVEFAFDPAAARRKPPSRGS